jgi:hypothetical protein
MTEEYALERVKVQARALTELIEELRGYTYIDLQYLELATALAMQTSLTLCAAVKRDALCS